MRGGPSTVWGSGDCGSACFALSGRKHGTPRGYSNQRELHGSAQRLDLQTRFRAKRFHLGWCAASDEDLLPTGKIDADEPAASVTCDEKVLQMFKDRGVQPIIVQLLLECHSRSAAAFEEVESHGFVLRNMFPVR